MTSSNNPLPPLNIPPFLPNGLFSSNKSPSGLAEKRLSSKAIINCKHGYITKIITRTIKTPKQNKKTNKQYTDQPSPPQQQKEQQKEQQEQQQQQQQRQKVKAVHSHSNLKAPL